MNIKPLVSVIINCYNGEQYLREAIDSVIAQTYNNWEIVFWDNQSTDSTREIVDSYDDSRIHYFYASKHTSLGEARNLAVEKANGEYINFLDADDVWSNDKLEKQITLIVPGKIEVVYTGYDIIADKEAKHSALYAAFMYNKDRKMKSILTIDDFLLNGYTIVFSSVLFNKRIYIGVGGINPKFEQNEDFDIILKFATKTDIGYVDGALTKYRIHGTNNSIVNGVLGYLENREIFKTMSPSKSLDKAIEINETRIVAYELKNTRSLKLFINEIIRKGRCLIFISLLIKMCLRRLFVLSL